MSAPHVRTVLFTGKGGVGKTTLAAAAAVRSARDGRRTLILSTDPAHSLGDVLQASLSGEPTSIAGTNGLLFAAEVDIRGRFEQAWSAIRDYLVGVLAARGVAEITAEELVVLPGADEILSLLEVETFAATGDFDVIVVDCAPTGETLRLLALPETLGFYADRLFAAPQRLLRSLAAGFTGRSTGPGDQVRDAIGDLLQRLSAARTLLTDPDASGVIMVSTAEQVVLAEARRALTAFSLHGYRVVGVAMNRLLPPEAEGLWAEGIRSGQQKQLLGAEESFTGIPMFRAPWLASEPTGVPALTELGEITFGAVDPIPDPSKPTVWQQLQVNGAVGEYSMTVPLPLADRGQVLLARSGDDLVITIGSLRRRIALPSLLQRCVSSGATFVGDSLVISFEPDPDRWPAALSGTL